MQTITLYKYEREGGGTTVSPNKPNTEYTITYRLVADEGMVLTNGEVQTTCIDTDNPQEWTEIPEPEPTDDVG